METKIVKILETYSKSIYTAEGGYFDGIIEDDFEVVAEALSNCCGKENIQQDSNGHGKCGECKENTVPDRRIDEDWWIKMAVQARLKWMNEGFRMYYKEVEEYCLMRARNY